MVKGVYNNSIPPHHIADIAGREVLGMGGSLTGYINTGNAYDNRYYEGGDNFVNSKKQSKKEGFNLKALLGAAIVVLGGISLVKFAPDMIIKLKNKLPNNAKQKLSKPAKAPKIKLPEENIFKRAKNAFVNFFKKP